MLRTWNQTRKLKAMQQKIDARQRVLRLKFFLKDAPHIHPAQHANLIFKASTLTNTLLELLHLGRCQMWRLPRARPVSQSGNAFGVVTVHPVSKLTLAHAQGA